MWLQTSPRGAHNLKLTPRYCRNFEQVTNVIVSTCRGDIPSLRGDLKSSCAFARYYAKHLPGPVMTNAHKSIYQTWCVGQPLLLHTPPRSTWNNRGFSCKVVSRPRSLSYPSNRKAILRLGHPSRFNAPWDCFQQNTMKIKKNIPMVTSGNSWLITIVAQFLLRLYLFTGHTFAPLYPG